MNSLIGLGRVHKPDSRDYKYLLPALRSSRTSRHWSSLGVLDQGATSQCVAYSGAKYLTSSPIRNKFNTSPQSLTELYKKCQRVDAWPGENYDGTSVRALMKVLQAEGYISEYRWAFDAGPVIQHLLEVGPVVVGTDWHMEMFMPDRNGYIAPLGDNVGGHAWTLVGVNTRKRNPDGTIGAVRFVNSWGRGWGQQGRAWITVQHLNYLIDRNGEAAVATEILK